MPDNDKCLTKPGFIVFITAPRVNTALRKPYGHSLKRRKLHLLIKQLKQATQPFSRSIGRYCFVDIKAITYGKKVGCYVSGYRPGAAGDPKEGITQKKWDALILKLESIIKKAIPEALVYAEPWTEGRAFQFRWEACVMIEEENPDKKKI